MILIACPACDRQYDVSHVPAGERVRCICDEVIEVGTQKSLRVRAMHCSHCGGALEGAEANCRWCGAKLTEADRVRSTLCPKCFTRIEDDARHCKGCGVAIAPQALTPLPEGGSCPRCGGGLLIRALGVADVVECGVCGGLWLTAKVFEAVCRDAERKLDTFLLAEPASAAPSPDPPGRKYIPCLACSELMLRKNFRHGARPSGVVVDYCRGHGVWLDSDELERIVAHVKRQGGGPPPTGAAEGLAAYLEPPVDVEKARRRARVRRRGELRRVGSGEGFGAFLLLEGVTDLLIEIGAALFD